MDRTQFNKWVHRFGISSSLILLAMMVAFPITVSAVNGIWPNFKEIWPACVALTLFMAPWWPGECIGYMSIMGPGALYMSYITGNVTNLRMPATVGTINALGIEPNTDECHTMAIIACGASNLTTITLLFIALLFSVPLRPLLESPTLQPAFNYALPALFGGLVAQTVIKSKHQFLWWLIPLAVCLFFCYCTNVGGSYYMLITVAVGALVFYLVDYKFAKDK